MARPRKDEAESRRAQRRLELTRGVAQVFWERGFYQTSMSEAAEAIGISKMVLYRYFPTKDGLMKAILTQGKASFEIADQRWWERDNDGTRLQDRRPGLIGALETVRADKAAALLVMRFAAQQPTFRSAYDEVISRTRQHASDRLSSWLRILPGNDAIWHLSVAAIADFALNSCVHWVEHGDPGHDLEFVDWMHSSLRSIHYGIRGQLLDRALGDMAPR